MSDPSMVGPKSFTPGIARLKQGEHLCSVYAEEGRAVDAGCSLYKSRSSKWRSCIYVVGENKKEVLIQGFKFKLSSRPRRALPI